MKARNARAFESGSHANDYAPHLFYLSSRPRRVPVGSEASDMIKMESHQMFRQVATDQKEQCKQSARVV